MNSNFDIPVELYETSRRYWEAKLQGYTEISSLPFNLIHSGNLSTKELFFHINEDMALQLLNISKNKDLSLFVILISLFKILLFKYSGQGDIVVASPPHSEGIINSNVYVPIRDFLASDMTFKEIVMMVKDSVTFAYKEQLFPIKQLLSDETKFNNFIICFDAIHKKDDIDYIVNELDNSIKIVFTRNVNKIEGKVFFGNNIDGNIIQQMIKHYTHLLYQVVQNINRKINEIEDFSN